MKLFVWFLFIFITQNINLIKGQNINYIITNTKISNEGNIIKSETPVEELLKKYTPIILKNICVSDVDANKDLLCSNKEDLNIRDLFYVYKEDIMNYYKLNAIYNTPLKVKIFKKSKEYKNKMEDIKKLKRKYKSAYFCIIDRPLLSNYDINKKCFYVKYRLNYSKKEYGDEYSYDDNIIPYFFSKGNKFYVGGDYIENSETSIIYWGIYLKNIKVYYDNGEKVFYYLLTINNEELALKIEENKDKILTLYIFNIDKIKNYNKSYKDIILTSDGFSIYRKPAIIKEHIHIFTIKNLKIIFANRETGEIYVIKKY